MVLLFVDSVFVTMHTPLRRVDVQNVGTTIYIYYPFCHVLPRWVVCFSMKRAPAIVCKVVLRIVKRPGAFFGMIPLHINSESGIPGIFEHLRINMIWSFAIHGHPNSWRWLVLYVNDMRKGIDKSLSLFHKSFFMSSIHPAPLNAEAKVKEEVKEEKKEEKEEIKDWSSRHDGGVWWSEHAPDELMAQINEMKVEEKKDYMLSVEDEEMKEMLTYFIAHAPFDPFKYRVFASQKSVVELSETKEAHLQNIQRVLTVVKLGVRSPYRHAGIASNLVSFLMDQVVHSNGRWSGLQLQCVNNPVLYSKLQASKLFQESSPGSRCFLHWIEEVDDSKKLKNGKRKKQRCDVRSASRKKSKWDQKA